MQRVREYLEPLTGAIRSKKFCVVDIESKDGEAWGVRRLATKEFLSADGTSSVKRSEDALRTTEDHARQLATAEDEAVQLAGFTRPFLIGTYEPTGDEYIEFRDEPHLATRSWQERYYAPGGCVDKFLTYILTPRFAGYMIYAHNGGGFDHLFWLKWLTDHRDEFEFEVVPVQSSIQKILVWRRPETPEEPIREKWEFLDSMKLLPMSLERACKTFGLDGKASHDLHLHETDPHWAVYLRRDCIALAEVLTMTFGLIENKLGGEVGMTAPSTSMKLYRRKYLGRDGAPLKVPRHAHWLDCRNRVECSGCMHTWVRQAYYGGRTEVFRTRGENLHYYDINSSYVAAMRETMPAGEREVTSTLEWQKHRTHVGFVECTVEIPADCYLPPLPHRALKTDKLIFPAGRFHGVWDVSELELLYDPLVGGRITDVRKVVWFKRRGMFEGMVDELWQLRDKRREGYDEGLSAMAKLMGNSLYGKFGMKQDRTGIVFTRPFEENRCILCSKPLVPGDVLCKACVGSQPASGEYEGGVWYQAKHVDAAYIIPQIAAHITALARIRIWKFMKAALEAGGQLFYSDTDSLITDAVLESSSELGALKDEYPGVEDLRGSFIQPKVYMLESSAWEKAKITMKGFPPSMRTKENLEKLLAGQTLGWRRLEKVRSLARLQFDRGPLMGDVTKSFKGRYDKRVLTGDGNTSPLVLDEPYGFDNAEAAE